MIYGIHRFIVRRWIMTRMAAQEFYYKQNFEIGEEYTILKTIMVFSLVPVELIFVFTYARIYGSLSKYSLTICGILFLINILIANIVINRLKGSQLVGDTMADYELLDNEARQRFYSFRMIWPLIFLTTILPWVICGIAIFVVCRILPINPSIG